MRIKDIRDIMAGALLILIGGGVAITAQSYGIGRMTEAGPGFFPALLGGMLALVGVGVAITGFDFSGTAEQAQRIRIDGWHLWCLFIIALGFVLFGFLLPVAGLFVTSFVTITTVSIGSRLLQPISALTVAAVLAAVSVVLFRYLLDLQVQAWPWGG